MKSECFLPPDSARLSPPYPRFLQDESYRGTWDVNATACASCHPPVTSHMALHGDHSVSVHEMSLCPSPVRRGSNQAPPFLVGAEACMGAALGSEELLGMLYSVFHLSSVSPLRQPTCSSPQNSSMKTNVTLSLEIEQL